MGDIKGQVWLSTEGIEAGKRLKLDDGSKLSLPMFPSGTWFTMDRFSSNPANVVVYHGPTRTRFKLATSYFEETVGESPDSLYSDSQEALV